MKTFFKFLLYIAWVVVTSLTISCSTVHKNITSTKKVEDSVTTLTKDTTNVAKIVAQKDDFSAKGVDITLNYGPEATITDTTKPVVLQPVATGEDDDTDDKFKQLIQDAVSNYSTPGHIVSSVTIHIDSVTNAAQKLFTSDSSNLKEQSTLNVKTTTDTKDKVISKTGLSVWVYVLLGVGVIIALVVFAVKIGFKFI